MFVPASYDPHEHARRIGKPGWGDYFAWVVSHIYIRRHIDDIDGRQPVPLAASLARRFLPRRTSRRMLDDLCKAKVIETDGKWYPPPPGRKGRCRHYRITVEHDRNYRSYIIKHTELVNKMTKHAKAKHAKVKGGVHHRLRDWQGTITVHPDAPFGVRWQLDRLIDGCREYTVDPQGRAHTGLTGLPAECRQWVRVAGREMVSVDVGCAQPLLLGLTIKRTHYPDATIKLPPQIPTTTTTTTTATTPPTTSSASASTSRPIVVTLSGTDKNDTLAAQLADYLTACLDGSLYARLIAEVGPGRSGKLLPRPRVKKLGLAVLYGNPRDHGTRVGKAFRRLWPAVLDAVAKLYRKLGHGGLPRQMQRAESSLMFDRVAARVIRERPDMPLGTIHDCLLIPPEAESYARQVLEEEWMAEWGVVPRLDTTRWTDPQEQRAKKKKAKTRNTRPAPADLDDFPVWPEDHGWVKGPNVAPPEEPNAVWPAACPPSRPAWLQFAHDGHRLGHARVVRPDPAPGSSA
ncbi:MAG: hypothetical protein U0871_10905 [Gemmataceae bacterium]